MNTANAPDALLDAQGLARRLNVGVGTVDELRRSGRIPCVRLGPKTVRFDWLEVMAALRGDDRQDRQDGAA